MKPIEFPEKNVTFAEDQPEYQPLPAFKAPGGQVVCCWELSEEEVKVLTGTRKLWLGVMTFNQPLQPVYPTVYKSEVIVQKQE